MQKASSESGERQQVQPIVLEHADERFRIGGMNESKVACRRLEARNIVDSASPEKVMFERRKRARLDSLG